MKRILITLMALASLTIATVSYGGKPKAAMPEIVLVNNENEANATHIYFVNETYETDYELNPKAFARGWYDGWNWIAKPITDYDKQKDKDPSGFDAPILKRPTRAAIEAQERKLYGNIDNTDDWTPGVKALGFDAACSFLWKGSDL